MQDKITLYAMYEVEDLFDAVRTAKGTSEILFHLKVRVYRIKKYILFYKHLS